MGEMFEYVTLNTDSYSDFLGQCDIGGQSDVTLHGGYSKYNNDGKVSRDNIVNRGWTVTDGGHE
jgi:hypothetical protein